MWPGYRQLQAFMQNIKVDSYTLESKIDFLMCLDFKHLIFYA